MSVAEDYLRFAPAAAPSMVTFIPKPSSTMTPSPNNPGEGAARWIPWAERQVLPIGDYGENWDGYNAAAPVTRASETQLFF